MKRSQIQLISAMLIFGSLGLFVHQLTLSSALIAFFRAVIGGCFFIPVSMPSPQTTAPSAKPQIPDRLVDVRHFIRLQLGLPV